MFIEILDRLKGERGPLLPKKKPEKEVKKRKLENFEKVKPALENPDEVRQMFYKGESVEEFLPRIKKLWKEGKGTKAIAKEILGSETKKTTIATAIDAMKSGEAPVKITKEDIELNKKNKRFPGIPGENVDKEGLEKAVKEFDGKTRPNLNEFGRKFGYADSGAVRLAIKKFGREDIYDLPEPKSKRAVEVERQAEINKNTITDKQFKAEYKKFKPVVTGSDAEFAKYLNDKGYTVKGGKPFTSDSAGSRRERAGISNKGKFVTTRGKLMDDKFILNEVKRMRLNIDTSKMTPDQIRTAVIKGRASESGKTDAEKERLYKFRERQAAMAGKKRIDFPINIGRNATPKDLFWRDLVENGFRHQAYLQGRPGATLPESHIKFLNPKQSRPTDLKSNFNIKLVDTNVLDKSGKPKVITYENFPKHLDKNKKLYGIDYDTAIKEYTKKRFIQKNPDLRDEFNKKLNKAYDPTSVSSRAVFSPMHIHHTAGRGRNAFNVQFAVASENMAENNLRRTFNRSFERATTLSDKKAAMKKYLDSVPDTLEVRLKNTPYGTRETLVDMTKRVAPNLSQQVIDRGGLKLGANLPLERAVEGTGKFLKSIPQDFLQGRKLRGAGKVLGVAALPLEAYFMKQMYDQGYTPGEILLSPLALDSVARGVRRRMRMTPVERQALTRQMIESDESGLSSDFYTPDLEGIEKIDPDAAMQKQIDREISEREALAKEREKPFFDTSMDDIYNLKEGGPVDPSKRKFMKFLAGIASIPFVGKYLKLAEPAQKVGIMATEGAKLGVDKLMMLVNKIKKLGTPDKTRQTQDLQEVTVYKGKDGSEYELVEDLATGDVKVTRDKGGIGVSGDRSYDTIEDRSEFMIKKGQADETTKGKKPPDEYEEGKAVFDQDGAVADIDDVDDVTIKAIDDELNTKKGFYKGGLTDTTPPKRGPMNQGIAGVYQNL